MPEELPEFKSQPWIVYDTIASNSFLVGENRPAFFASGTNGPAITAAGEMIFFSAGRTQPTQPWYTSTELVGQLSYGFEAWQVYVHFGFPAMPDRLSNNPYDETDPPTVMNFGTLLMQAIINFGVLQMDLGQEQQMSWPVHRFGAGGGFFQNPGFGVGVGQNSMPDSANVLKLPEPIEIARTQNLNAKIRIAPEILAHIGSNLAPGVGDPILAQYTYDGAKGEATLITLPYTVQVGLIGRRIKKTQYGQVPGEQGGK